MNKFVMLLVVISTNMSLGQNHPVTASLVTMLGADTIMVDTYTITNNHLHGKAFIRLFENHVREYDIIFNRSGSIARYVISAMNPNNSSLPLKPATDYFPLHTEMIWANDTAYFTIIEARGREAKRNWPAPSIDFVAGWVPIFPLMDWTHRRLIRSGKSTLSNLKTTNTWGVTDISIRNISQDTLIFGGPFIDFSKIILEQDSAIAAINGIGSAYNFLIMKTSPLDVDLMSRRMSKKSALVVPSPRDLTVFNIHNNKIAIEYGRPFARGRKIFGGVVPYDSLWRTGANEPTLISLEKNIRIGNSVIPKGRYSLYSVPMKERWILIFSNDLESWPTNPDRTKEFAHIELSVHKTLKKIDQFTIAITENRTTGLLRLIWDDIEASIEFKNL